MGESTSHVSTQGLIFRICKPVCLNNTEADKLTKTLAANLNTHVSKDQQANEKMLNIINHYGNTNENHFTPTRVAQTIMTRNKWRQRCAEIGTPVLSDGKVTMVRRLWKTAWQSFIG